MRRTSRGAARRCARARHGSPRGAARRCARARHRSPRARPAHPAPSRLSSGIAAFSRPPAVGYADVLGLRDGEGGDLGEAGEGGAAHGAARSLRVLLLTGEYGSVAERLHLDLEGARHRVTVELALNAAQMVAAVERVNPDVVVCPGLETPVPEDVWRFRTVLTVHTGLVGDRGHNPLDWALLNGDATTGVTVRSCAAMNENGAVWATRTFDIGGDAAEDAGGGGRRASRTAGEVTKSALYRNEAGVCSSEAVLEALGRLSRNEGPLSDAEVEALPGPRGAFHRPATQADRAVDWTRPAREVARRIAASDSEPGVVERVLGVDLALFGAHVESELNHDGSHAPGSVVAQRNGALCIATGGGGAVWVVRARAVGTGLAPAVKVQTCRALGGSPEALRLLSRVPHSPADPMEPLLPGRQTWRDVWVEERPDGAVYVHFPFYGGLIGADQAVRLRRVLERVAADPHVRVVALMGGPDAFGLGMDYTMIEAADDPVAESRRSADALNEAVRCLMGMTDKLTVAVLQGTAAGGGLMLALAADIVYAHRGVIVSPHFSALGLYGSAYWTYILPRRVGDEERARALTYNLRSLDARSALSMGLVSELIGKTASDLRMNLPLYTHILARRSDYDDIVAGKRQRLSSVWRERVEQHRRREMMIMEENFRSRHYRRARYRFVHKLQPTDTPQHLVSGAGLGKILDGKKIAGTLAIETRAAVERGMLQLGAVPGLAIVQVGSDAASDVYVRNKVRAAEAAGFRMTVRRIPADGGPGVWAPAARAALSELDADPDVDGLMIQSPLPPGGPPFEQFTRLVSVEKDVDAFSALHVGRLLVNYSDEGSASAAAAAAAATAAGDGGRPAPFFVPCTARAIMELIDRYDIKVAGRKSVVVGASPVVGLPTAMLLVKHLSTVEMCHVHTRELEKAVREADILVSATGQKHLIKGEWIKKGAVVIDAGISVIGPSRSSGSGRSVVGDVEFAAARRRASYITPVPGGVGPLTVSMLLQNTLDAFNLRAAGRARSGSSTADFVGSFDRDGDGRLNRGELRGLILHTWRNVLGVRIPFRAQFEPLLDRTTDTLMARLDTDRSGLITPARLRNVNMLQEITSSFEEAATTMRGPQRAAAAAVAAAAAEATPTLVQGNGAARK